jgi:hypothetical protein
MMKSSRRNWRSEEAKAKAIEHLGVHPEASGSDIAKLLGVSETQGKHYRSLAIRDLELARTQNAPET